MMMVMMLGANAAVGNDDNYNRFIEDENDNDYNDYKDKELNNVCLCSRCFQSQAVSVSRELFIGQRC